MLRSYFLIALSMSLVGGTVAAAKVLSDDLPVLVIGFLRCLIASAVLWPVVLMMQKTRPKQIIQGLTRDDMIPIFGQAFFGILLFTTFLFVGVRMSSALSAGIISATLPAVIALLSFFWLSEKISARKWFSIALAIGGVAILNLRGGLDAGTGSLLGNGLIFLAVLSEAAYVIYAKQSADRLPVTVTALLVNFAGLILYIPFALPQLISFDFTAVSPLTWAIMFIYPVTASVLALLFWYEGVKHVPANVAGLFTGIVPLSAGTLAILFLGELPTLAHFAGVALVLFAIWLGAFRTESP